MTESNTVRLARLEEKFDAMAQDIESIKKSLDGNGKPGIIGRLGEVERKLAENNGVKKTVFAIFGSSLVTGLIVFGIQRIYS